MIVASGRPEFPSPSPSTWHLSTPCRSQSNPVYAHRTASSRSSRCLSSRSSNGEVSITNFAVAGWDRRSMGGSASRSRSTAAIKPSQAAARTGRNSAVRRAFGLRL